MKGWVYFLRFGSDGPIKVGCSTDPVARAYDLNVASPVELVLLGAMKSTSMKHEEPELHKQRAGFRIRRVVGLSCNHDNGRGETRHLIPFGSKPDGRDLGWLTKPVAQETVDPYSSALEEF